jgi:hypothetical protein
MIWQRMPLSTAIFLRGSATPRRRCLVAGQPADGADDVDGSAAAEAVGIVSVSF